MTAVAVQIAGALVAALNGHTFNRKFTAIRAYLPCFKLEEMGTLHVTVIPATFESESADRSSDKEKHTIHVAVQQKFAQDDGAVAMDDLDAMMAICEEIRDFLRTLVLPGAQDTRRSKTECKPIYDPNHLKKFGQFTGLLAFTYSVVR